MGALLATTADSPSRIVPVTLKTGSLADDGSQPISTSKTPAIPRKSMTIQLLRRYIIVMLCPPFPEWYATTGFQYNYPTRVNTNQIPITTNRMLVASFTMEVWRLTNIPIRSELVPQYAAKNTITNGMINIRLYRNR